MRGQGRGGGTLHVSTLNRAFGEDTCGRQTGWRLTSIMGDRCNKKRMLAKQGVGRVGAEIRGKKER